MTSPEAPVLAAVSTTARVLRPVSIGAAVAVLLGAYAALHPPTGLAVNLAGFSSAQSVKAWLATVAVALAGVQVVSALGLYGRVAALDRRGTATVHRWSGRAAFLVSIPVAVHCLYALGFDGATPRTLLHSLAGCLFYGAFTTKMLVLPQRGLPGVTVPLAGALVFTGLTAVWVTSGLWFFTTFGVRL